MQTNKYAFAASAILATVLLIAGTAVGLGSGPTLVGKNGVTPALVFGKSDVRDTLPDDWDHDNLKLGFQRIATLSVDRTLVVTSSGTDTLVYLPLSIRDATEGDYMGIIEVTVAGSSVDSVRTVLRTPWDRDVTSATWTDAFSSLALVEDGVGPVSDGDLLVSRQEVSSGGILAMVVYHLDPDDGVMAEIYREEDSVPISGRLATMTDGSGDFVFADAILVSWDGVAFEGVDFLSNGLRFESRHAIGTDGYLYGTLNVTDVGSNKNTGIYKVDPYGDNEYVRVGTTKWNGVSKSISSTFDQDEKFWSVDKKGADHFLSKQNKRGKLPFKKRIAEWNATDECARLVELEESAGRLYALVLETGTSTFPANTGVGEEIEVWVLAP